MLGIEINFIVDDEWVEVEGPFFTKDDLFSKIVNELDIANYFDVSHKVEITVNEYLGNESDGFHFNNCFKKIEIEFYDDFINWINENF